MEGVLLWEVNNNLSLVANIFYITKRKLNQHGKRIWALSTSKQEGSEECHYRNEEGLKM